MQLLALNPHEHKCNGFARPSDFLFTKNDPVAVVDVDELKLILVTNPLTFVRDKKDNFALVSMQGIYKSENVCIDENGRWILRYVPKIYQTYPFVLAESDDKKKLLCFNMQSGLYRDTPNLDLSEELFFNEEGVPNATLKHIIDFLAKKSVHNTITNKAVAAIVAADLLEPWILDLDNSNTEKQLMKGLYKINEKKLAALSPDELKELQDVNALPIIYAQLFSMPRIQVLKQLHDLKAKKQEQKLQQEMNLDEFFGEASNDTLSFDF